MFMVGILILLSHKTGIYGIEIYEMENMCGQRLNMRWKDIYTAEIRLNPAFESHVANTSEGKTTEGRPVLSANKYAVTSGVSVCSMTIESWDFQDRMMFYIKDVRFRPKCSEARLELFDGPTYSSSSVTGFERPVCNERRRRMSGRTFMTSDKYITLRLLGTTSALKNISFTMVVVSFHDGDCMSYEHKCPSGICIMKELVCNGHNPCGDNSDCPVSPPEVAAEEPHVINAAIITASIFLVGVVIGLVLFCRCYHKRLKLRRQRLHQLSLEHTENPATNEDDGVERNFSDDTIQNEAIVQLYSPPSYNSLKNADHEDFERCLEESKNSTLPPSYSCVMSHQDKFHLSYTDLNKIKLSNMQKASLSEPDINNARS